MQLRDGQKLESQVCLSWAEASVTSFLTFMSVVRDSSEGWVKDRNDTEL